MNNRFDDIATSIGEIFNSKDSSTDDSGCSALFFFIIILFLFLLAFVTSPVVFCALAFLQNEKKINSFTLSLATFLFLDIVMFYLSTNDMLGEDWRTKTYTIMYRINSISGMISFGFLYFKVKYFRITASIVIVIITALILYNYDAATAKFEQSHWVSW